MEEKAASQAPNTIETLLNLREDIEVTARKDLEAGTTEIVEKDTRKDTVQDIRRELEKTEAGIEGNMTEDMMRERQREKKKETEETLELTEELVIEKGQEADLTQEKDLEDMRIRNKETGVKKEEEIGHIQEIGKKR